MTIETFCYCINIRRAANKITALYNRYLASVGITASQYSLLSRVKNMAPVSVSDLTKQLELERTTLVRSLKPLEKSGLICDIATQGRSRQLILTKNGEAVLAQAKELWKKAQSALEELMGAERISLYDELIHTINNIDE